ncbi:MAG: FecCD family ABC transporter permease [Archaeoglobaceae archaeon]
MSEISEEEVLARYREYAGKKLIFSVVSILLLFIMFIFSIVYGPVNIPVSEVFGAITGQSLGQSSHFYNIIWNIRLPQALTAIAAGAGLAISGAVMQSVLRNPLGSPFTLGISHAAAFGAAFSIIALGAGTMQSSSADAVILNNPYITTISAFMWSLVSTLIIIGLATYKRASPETMILTGVALGSLFTAGITAMQYFASDVELAAVVFWTFGDVGRTTWQELGLIAAIVIPSTIYFAYNSWNYNALDSGDETARSLGVNVERLRVKGMLLASLVTALIVSFVGIIGFIGLVVPHIVRKAVGGNEMFLLPSSCLLGGLLLLASDTVARNLLAPVVLPVGILTSFLGAPLFIYLVVKGREYW